MKMKTVLSIVGAVTFMVIASGAFLYVTAGSKGGSKLTIAYIADEIGRLEPCG